MPPIPQGKKASLTNILMHVIIQLIKGVAAFCTAAGPKNGFRPPCSKGGPCYFLSITHREITPTITKQNSNNSLYVTIGITPLAGKWPWPPSGKLLTFYFSIFWWKTAQNRGKTSLKILGISPPSFTRYLHLPQEHGGRSLNVQRSWQVQFIFGQLNLLISQLFNFSTISVIQ